MKNVLLAFVYPQPGTRVLIPRNAAGKLKKVVFKVTHQNPGIKLYWDLDYRYLGSSQFKRHVAFTPGKGLHTLTVVDENGLSKSVHFEVVEGE